MASLRWTSSGPTCRMNQQWLPAVENRGEGVFIGFSTRDIEAWIKRPGLEASRLTACSPATRRG